MFNIRYNFRYDNTGTAQYQNILTILTFKLQIKSLLKRKKRFKIQIILQNVLNFPEKSNDKIFIEVETVLYQAFSFSNFMYSYKIYSLNQKHGPS